MPAIAPLQGAATRVAARTIEAAGDYVDIGAPRIRAPRNSRVVGTVAGVDLLSNPLLPPGVHARWAVPPGTLFGEAPDVKVGVHHLDQGMLGDCWLLAAAGAIADRSPRTIQSLFKEGKDTITVKLADGPVAVSRELPMSHGKMLLGGGDAGDPVLWPAYLEKAVAAIAPGGYRALDGGQPMVGYRLLLGEVSQYRTAPKDLLGDLARRLRRGEPAVVGSRPQDTPTRRTLANRYDVVGLHGYIVHDVSRDLTGKQLVHLVNPWGATHPRPMPESALRELTFTVQTPRENYYVAPRRS